MSTYRLECPACHHSNDIFLATGTLVTGEMSVRIGQNGIVLSVGPIRPKAVVKPGCELKGRFSLTCPSCSYAGRHDTFIPITTSLLSGRVAQTVLSVAYLGEDIPITLDEQNEARTMFSTEAMSSWDDTDRILTLLGGT